MNVTVIGGGNIGTQFAVRCSAHGHKVTVFTSKVGTFLSEVKEVDADGAVVSGGTVDCITFNPSVAVKNSDVVFITTPAFLAKELAEKLLPYIENGTKIFFIPGSGGMEWAFKAALGKKCSLYGLQRVPSVTRLKGNGLVYCEGYRDRLYIASLPKSEAQFGKEMLECLFDIPCDVMDNYLNVTMVPSNPILHTCRLYSLFNDYSAGKVYHRIPLFYQEWTDETSDLLLKCDDEVQSICGKIRELSGFDMSGVKSLKEHYESYTVKEMTDKIKSIKGFQGLQTPSIPKGNGYVPDFDSRYFTADFPYGLKLLCEIARLSRVDTPYMNTVLAWYNKLSPNRPCFDFSDYGIETYNRFSEFYAK